MFNSLFRRKKPKNDAPTDDSIRSARVGDVVYIPGLWETGDDAYLIVEQVGTLESDYGESHELAGVDGDRRATIEWSDQDGLHISVTEQDRPMGLSEVGLEYDTLVAWDDHKSLDNAIEYNGRTYHYRNSYEAFHRSSGASDSEGFYVWEFVRDDDEGSVTVVKWEGLPFEVYASESVSPHVVMVYHR